MGKIINITDKLNNEKPVIQLGDKIYTVNDGMNVVFKFEELTVVGTKDSMLEAIKLTLGEEAVNELGIESMSINNFKVITIAILAAVQGIDYEVAEARFQNTK